MSTSRNAPKQPALIALKEQRAKDAALAMSEYEAERVAVINNTARLRAMRLESAAAAALVKKEEPKKTKKRA